MERMMETTVAITEATRAFQRAAGLTEDGILGPETRRALEQAGLPTGAKPWWLSRTVWAGVLALVAGAGGALFGWELAANEQAALVDLVLGVLGAAAGAGAIWGRHKAGGLVTSRINTATRGLSKL